VLCTYTGTDTRYYMDYRDGFTGVMLQASPGDGLYDIIPASGQPAGLPVPPGDGRWAVVPVQQAKAAKAAPVPAAQRAAPAKQEAGDRPAEEEQ
jgi:hypothetical protein